MTLSIRRGLRVESFAGFVLVPLIVIGMSILAAASSAAPLAVTNPGFEDISGETPVNEFTFGPLNGWSLYDPDTITGGGAGGTYFLGTLTPFEPDPVGAPGIFAFFPDGALEGQRVGIAFNFFGSGGQGEWGFEQILADTLQPFTHYTLEVGVGNIASGTSIGGQAFPLDGFPGYRVQLLVDNVIVAQDDNSLAGSIPDGAFGTSTVHLATGASPPEGQLSIRLINLNLVDPAFPNSDLEVDFDDVRLDATPIGVAVPSLGTPLHALLAVALAILGVLGVASRRFDQRPRVSRGSPFPRMTC